MKKILWLIASLLLVGIASCSNDDTVTDPPAVDKTPNLKAAGDSANDFLSNDNYDHVVIEAAYVNGFKPTAQAMAQLVTFIKEHTFKQNIEIVYKEVGSPQQESLSLEEIVELEEKHRSKYNQGTSLALFIYFADAPSEDDDEDQGLVTLGAVFRNTSMIIHEVTVRKLANLSNSISATDVETATLNHEFGHLLGLVDLGSPMVNDHEDSNARNHCTVSGCLMRAELQFDSSGKGSVQPSKSLACTLTGASVLKMLESNTSKGAIVPELGSECQADIANNGGR
ncbi:MAG: hypothetical protein AB3N16_02415 [Flavobacteriaceae bacterium]